MTVEFARFSKCKHCNIKLILVIRDADERAIAILCPNCDGPEVDAITLRLFG